MIPITRSGQNRRTNRDFRNRLSVSFVSGVFICFSSDKPSTKSTKNHKGMNILCVPLCPFAMTRNFNRQLQTCSILCRPDYNGTAFCLMYSSSIEGLGPRCGHNRHQNLAASFVTLCDPLWRDFFPGRAYPAGVYCTICIAVGGSSLSNIKFELFAFCGV